MAEGTVHQNLTASNQTCGLNDTSTEEKILSQPIQKASTMSRLNTPKSYPEWRTGQLDRAEDAAHVFGYHLMKHCRSEAIDSVNSATLPESTEELQRLIASAVDVALHNVMDLLEGFWKTNVDPGHEVTYALSVCVKRVTDRKPLERVEVSPGLVDLPIGYWKWKDGEFR